MMRIGSTDVYASEFSGMIDVCVRADSLAVFESVCVAYEIAYPENEQPRRQGHLRTKRGVSISHIGPVPVTRLEKNLLGVEVQVQTVDTRHHANIRIHDQALQTTLPDGSLKYRAMLLEWMQGDDDILTNKSERGKKKDGVTLLDASLISTPRNVWL